ncbi:MAG: hypothetical protein RhofKO_07460 [Rhodothermales bacterium]
MNMEQQIAAATAPAPEDRREGATVLGYNVDGELVTLREGTNDLLCLADNPSDERLHVVCYQRDLEPFMKRGRELSAEGKNRAESRAQRKAEIEAGTLTIPEQPSALYSLTGELNTYDATTGAIDGASPLYVVYIPYATPETTGLSTSAPGPGAPWIMDAGEPWAHIMIVPPRQ